MNVLVTGAAGFAGCYLLEHFRESCGRATHFCLARDPPPEASAADIHWLQADLADPDAAGRAVQAAEPDAIYHLAGHASAAGGRPEVFRANVDVSMNLLTAA